MVRILLFLSFLMLSDQASASFFDHRAEGWHWYEDKRKKEEPSEDIPTTQESPQDPQAQLELFKEQMRVLKAKALMDPTYDNVKAYMLIQKEMMEKANRFSSRWKEVVYTSPDLDYTVKHPTAQAARHVYLDLERQKVERAIAQLSKSHGLFFFYSSSCAYCRAFAPIVKTFASKYGWEVLAISMDGSQLPEFPDFQIDNGTAHKLGIEVLPSLIAVEPTSGQMIPLSYGYSAQDQIEDRIRVLLLKRRPT